MLPLSPGALLTLALLAGTAGAADPPRASECSAAPLIDLMAKPAELVPGVCVNPGAPTTFVFGAPLPSGAVVLSDNRSVDFAQGGAFVTVYPKRSFLPGERVKLTVRFGDGAAPEEAAFWLVGHAEQGVRSVEVFRSARSADELKREAAEARAEASQCQKEKARLLAERTKLGGLMGAAWLERTEEIHSKDLLEGLVQHPGNALTVEEATSYSNKGSIAVRLLLRNFGTETWTATEAMLTNSMGVDVVLSLWRDAAISSGSSGFVVVGVEKSSEQLGCPCSLKLREEQQARAVTMKGVTFPF
ncbi:hypothetical protein CYFUS_008965 [Cystobacter fuscus]|uniref:Lipoprotein n=1 Tax=Cystobacter fuscus TaxID=43 RepID=A0A250JHX0_9BACT|nr:DUF2381 family protein [Cystobacter fuscus]ATB43485.1 hypothetical protein CYFUS_008965 [Cystobacter fuscus]